MVAFRHGCSRYLARVFETLYERRITSGALVPVSPSVWGKLPTRVRQWLIHYVTSPAEATAFRRLEVHDCLAHLCDEPMNEWMLAPSKLLFLWQLCLGLRPRRILEFGSGRSTQLFAAYARLARSQGEEVRICTLEHDADWARRTKECLEKNSASGVTLNHAPLSHRELLGKTYLTYTPPEGVLQQIAGNLGFDLCLIDGPPEKIGRFACLPLAAPYLATGASILVDDCYRPKEQAMLRDWCKMWERLQLPQYFLGGMYGVATTTWGVKNRQFNYCTANEFSGLAGTAT
jgi:predicted O-methyltransferase YrrM